MRDLKIIYLFFLAMVSLLTITIPAYAEYQKIHACDEVAAHPGDKMRWGKGVSDEEIAPGRAISLCTSAVKAHPDTLRFHFQLGRVLWLAEQYDKAVDHLNRAIEGGYAAAQMYVDNIETEPEEEVAEEEIIEDAEVEDVPLQEETQEKKQVKFSLNGFQEPGIIEGLYRGDFSLFPANYGKFAIDVYLVEFHGYFNQDYSFLQDLHLQNPAACGLLYDPALDQALANKALFQNNPVWGNETDPMKQGGKALGALLGSVLQMQKPGGMKSLMNEGLYGMGGMNMETLKKKAKKDALTLASKYGCEGDITVQVYKNIGPYVHNQPGYAPVTNKRLAQDLTDGCYSFAGSSSTPERCSCVLNAILQAGISEEEQELLAASFSSRRVNRMKEKYPKFGQKIVSCGMS